jgi:hypothetical protein
MTTFNTGDFMMFKQVRGITPGSGLTLAACLVLAMTFAPMAWADDGFDEIKVLIEMNATDGDVGFHALFDAGAWKEVRMDDPIGRKIFDEKAFQELRTQGLTENFFESAEPVCDAEDAEDDDPVVSLAEFIGRFPDGLYMLYGKDNEGEHFSGEGLLTYDLPAAPDISATDRRAYELGGDVVVEWEAGDDLGEKCTTEGVEEFVTVLGGDDIIGWEIVVEPAEEGVFPERVFSVQLPAGDSFDSDYLSVTIPAEFIEAYVEENDIVEFKFEVGAIEASGNQTFSEGEFCLDELEDGETEDDLECEEDEED